MADFPEKTNVNPVAPPPQPRETGRRKPPVDDRESKRRKRRPDEHPPGDGHVLDEYA